MGLWLPKQKPPGGTILNPSHPLAKGLIVAWMLNERTGTMIAGQPRADRFVGTGSIYQGTSPLPVWNPQGLEFDYGVNRSNQVTFPNQDIFDGATTEWSFTGSIIPLALYSYDRIFANEPGNFFVSGHGGGSPQQLRVIDNGGTARLSNAGTIISNGVKVTIGGCQNFSAINGVQYAWAAAPSGMGGQGSQPCKMGHDADAQQGFDGTIEYFYIWKRNLTIGEFRWLHAEPYAMFQPRKKQRYWLASAAPATLEISVHDCTDTFESLH